MQQQQFQQQQSPFGGNPGPLLLSLGVQYGICRSDEQGIVCLTTITLSLDTAGGDVMTWCPLQNPREWEDQKASAGGFLFREEE